MVLALSVDFSYPTLLISYYSYIMAIFRLCILIFIAYIKCTAKTCIELGYIPPVENAYLLISFASIVLCIVNIMTGGQHIQYIKHSLLRS